MASYILWENKLCIQIGHTLIIWSAFLHCFQVKTSLVPGIIMNMKMNNTYIIICPWLKYVSFVMKKRRITNSPLSVKCIQWLIWRKIVQFTVMQNLFWTFSIQTKLYLSLYKYFYLYISTLISQCNVMYHKSCCIGSYLHLEINAISQRFIFKAIFMHFNENGFVR